MGSRMTGGAYRDLALLPKGHLHLHFEAAIRRETLDELVAGAGISSPAWPERGDFSAFAEAFVGVIGALSLPGALRRVTIEAAEDARDQGVVYVELAVSPQFYAGAYGSVEAALRELTDAAAEATRATGVEVRLMITFDRTAGLDDAIQLSLLAVNARSRGVVSVGLANNEVGHPAAGFLPAFEIARAAGLKIAPHAGELLGPESVAEAIDEIRADRVQHGIRAIEDPTLLARIAAMNVCLDVCPTSNVFLGVVADIAVHPLAALLAAGVRCSINADDPTFFGATILDEYRTARSDLGLTDTQLADCARTSIQFSSASAPVRESALLAIDAWLATGTDYTTATKGTA